MNNIVAILLLIAGLAMVLFFVLMLVAFVRFRRLSNLPPPPLRNCPACGSDQIDDFESGLWDGYDSAGRGTGGGCAIGTCKNCGVHCEHYDIWDNDTKQSRSEARVLTVEEWERRTAFSKKLHQRQSKWPFMSEVENHVAS